MISGVQSYSLGPTQLLHRGGIRMKEDDSGRACSYKDILSLADEVNRVAFGVKFEVIEDPNAFKEAYERLLSDDSKGEGIIPNPYNLSELSTPKLDGERLQFYVKDKSTSIPYRVTCQMGDVEDPQILCQLLPY